MTLSGGTRLGPYEIIEPLGAGGMGEVYKSRDTRLERTVALKVVSASLASDPTWRQRFDREARILAALSNPHICPIFDVGRHDGVDFLVMEYLDGETLTARLARGPLPVDLALRHAIEIADALAAAHREGVCHRDLKPGNVMLTRSGATAARLRPRQSGPASFTPERPSHDLVGFDRDRNDSRHRPVHGAGAVGGKGNRRAHRHLRLWLSRVRDGDGPKGVRRAEPGERDCGDPRARTAADVESSAHGTSRVRSCGQEVSREGSGGALAERAGSAGRAEVDCRGKLAGGRPCDGGGSQETAAASVVGARRATGGCTGDRCCRAFPRAPGPTSRGSSLRWRVRRASPPLGRHARAGTGREAPGVSRPNPRWTVSALGPFCRLADGPPTRRNRKRMARRLLVARWTVHRVLRGREAEED